MPRNENQTCRELIEPALQNAGWTWERGVVIGPGRVNLAGESMYDETQQIIADYVLRYAQMPLAILEAKAEGESAADGMQQGSRYANRLGLRYSIATNGTDFILTDNETGNFESLTAAPTPTEILGRLGYQVDWPQWRGAFETPWHEDQVTRKKVRPYQEMAIYRAMCCFGSGKKKILLLMATGTGKTFVVFQLVWKLFRGNALRNQRVLFLTDRNSLKDQAYRAFAALPADERVVIDKDVVSQGMHRVGKVFFANYQNLDEELDGKKLYEHYEPDFFDLIVVDECHRSGFGDWFGVLRHFDSAFQLGLTATPRELDQEQRPLTPEELRRDTYEYFGDAVYTYSLRQAIEDGYLVPYLLEQRVSNVDEDGYTGPDGRQYTTSNFERDIRLPERTTLIAEDLWDLLGKYDLREEKTIVFCVDDTHAAFMAQELRRLSGDQDFAARITRSERNSHQLERNFAEVGKAKPRVAVTVDLLTTGFDAPDVKNIVFARPLRSSILYKQMKGRGTRLCEDINKRYFTIFDYTGASSLEDSEFDGHPANVQKSQRQKKKAKKPATPSQPKPVAQGVSCFIQTSERYVCLADGRKIPFDEYREQSRDVIRSVATTDLDQLLKIWIDKNARRDLRNELKDRDIHIAAFRHFYEMDSTDDVDILAKVGFDLVHVPERRDRVTRFWDNDSQFYQPRFTDADLQSSNLLLAQDASSLSLAAEQAAKYASGEHWKLIFWRTALDHYSLFGIDDLEQGTTYSAPQFVEQFGSFSTLLTRYGGAALLKTDLEEVKRHLYVPMMN
jgi:type I restriction enzyme R subunit